MNCHCQETIRLDISLVSANRKLIYSAFEVSYFLIWLIYTI